MQYCSKCDVTIKTIIGEPSKDCDRCKTELVFLGTAATGAKCPPMTRPRVLGSGFARIATGTSRGLMEH